MIYKPHLKCKSFIDNYLKIIIKKDKLELELQSVDFIMHHSKHYAKQLQISEDILFDYCLYLDYPTFEEVIGFAKLLNVDPNVLTK